MLLLKFDAVFAIDINHSNACLHLFKTGKITITWKLNDNVIYLVVN